MKDLFMRRVTNRLERENNKSINNYYAQCRYS